MNSEKPQRKQSLAKSNNQIPNDLGDEIDQ